MSRIKNTFAALAAQGRKGLIPFITAGDPNPEQTVEFMHALAKGGAETSDALATGDVHTSKALATAHDSTGNALQKSYHKTIHALGTSAWHVRKALGDKSASGEAESHQ